MQLLKVYLLAATLLLCSIAKNEVTVGADENAHQSDNRSYSTDEGSCICGLNKEILDKIEAIVTQASKIESCPVSANQQDGSENSSPSPSSPSPSSSNEQPQTNESSETRPMSLGGSATGHGSMVADPSDTNADANHGGSWDILVGKLTSEIQNIQAHLANMRPLGSNKPDQQQEQQAGSESVSPLSSLWPQTPQQSETPSGSSSTESSGLQILSSIQTSANLDTGNTNDPAQQASSSSQPNESFGGASPSTPSDGFLQGLSQTSGSSSLQLSNEFGPPQTSSSLISGQIGGGGGSQMSIQLPDVQSALVSTVPSVVSNIFSNIQSMAIQTEHNSNASSSSSSSPDGNSNFITSIDGSSVHLNKNDTAAQITAQGENLFLQWVEHQIQAFHMTASMAASIRRSALSLFRRIVKQYVERIEKMGGRAEDNVLKATQVALSNTQNLISFLLKNYLNFAGGFMQIIGEQVSRVGKQLDSTGDTIAHINLNPFDIVSNVIDSLPNPSRYSEYFRTFGKYLMGESSTPQQQQQQPGSSTNDQQSLQDHQQQQQEQEEHGDRTKGLFSKTMGTLSKTLGSWLG